MRNSKLHTRLLSVFLVLWSSSWLVAQSEGENEGLRWKLEKGDQFKVELLQENQSTVFVDKRINQVNASTKITFDWNTLSAENDKFVIEQSIQSIGVKVVDPKVPEQAIEYATDSNEKFNRKSRELLKQIKPLIGLKFVVTMSPRGEITNVDIPDDSQKLIDELPNAIHLKAFFQNQGLKEIFRGSTVTFPESDEDQWKISGSVGSAIGEFARQTTCKKGTKFGNLQEIEMTTAIEKLSESDSDVMKVSSFEGGGTIKFDVDQGHIASSQTVYKVETEIPYREKSIKTTVSNEITMKLSRK